MIAASVVRAGYEGAFGALMHVRNAAGAVLNKNAKLGQIALYRLEEKVVRLHSIFTFQRVALDAMDQAKGDWAQRHTCC